MKYQSLLLTARCISANEDRELSIQAQKDRSDAIWQTDFCRSPNEKKRIRKGVLATAMSLVLVVGGCASSADSIEARYVSKNRYSDLNCSQIAQEMEQVDNRLTNLSSRQNDNAGADAALMTVGMIIFWPALFGLAATNDYEGEISQLKGEREALIKASIHKDCQTAPEELDLEDLDETVPGEPAVLIEQKDGGFEPPAVEQQRVEAS